MMKQTVRTRALALALLVCSSAPSLAAAAPQASAVLTGANRGGAARLWQTPTGVLMRVQLTGFSPGWHAIHFHAKGDCSDAKFEQAGGHINHAESKKPHGLLHSAGPDFGDLPNVHVGADGAGHAEVHAGQVSLRDEGGRPALLDADGSALVVHADADDHITQPIGGAGERQACGVITPASR